MKSVKEIHIKADEGERLEVNQDVMLIKLASAQTSGLFSLMERTVAGNFQSPPKFHAQSDTDWTCYVLEGRLEFYFEDKTARCGVGDVVYVPRGTFFRWSNPDPTQARALFLYTPGGFEGFFREVMSLIAKKTDRVDNYGETLSEILKTQDKYGMIRKP